MKKDPNQTAVGFFVILGFILLCLFVFFISGVYMFRPGYSLYVNYDNVSILDRGAPVRMAGVRVGEVNNVELFYDANAEKNRVRVKLFIPREVEVRDNYKFEVQGAHILSEPHIEITPVKGNAALLEDGAIIEGETLITMESLMDRAKKITENMEVMTSAMVEGENAENIRNMIGHMAKLTEMMMKMMDGPGKDLGKTVDNINKTVESLSALMDKINQGEGTVGKLLNNDELYQELRQFVAEIKARPWRLMKRDDDGKKFLIF